MRKLIYRALLLGAAGTLCAAAFAQTQTMQAPATSAMQRAASPVARVPQMEGLELLDRIGAYTAPLMAYQATKPSAEQIQNVVKLSGKLGEGAGVKFGGEALRSEGTRRLWSAPNDRSALFQLDARTGNFIFSGGMNRYRKDGSTQGLPTEQGAAELARSQLAKLGLRPEGGELKLAHVGGVNMGAYDGKGEPKIYEKLRTVQFSRVLGGLPVEGDSRIVVQLGEAGGMAGLTYQWPTLTTTKLERDALGDPQSVKARALEILRSVAPRAVRSKLVSVSLVLYDDGLGSIEPAYHFVVQQYFAFPPGTLTMNPLDFYLPVLKSPKVNLPKVSGAVANRPGEDRKVAPSGMPKPNMQAPAGQ